jgi:LytS/YehU family sensor histidine kinase
MGSPQAPYAWWSNSGKPRTVRARKGATRQSHPSDPSDYKVPPLVIQPFVENAIHHGLLNKLDGVKKLDIDVHMEDHRIKYTVTDNGVGRAQAAAYKKLNRLPQASYGVQMTNERIELFNQHANGSIRITDLYDDESKPSGTMVEVWLTTQPIHG